MQPDSILLGYEILTMSPVPQGAVRIQLPTFSRHIHINGTTGSGKSNTAKIICHGLLEKHLATVVLDRTGEYAEEFADAKDVVILRPGENLSIAPFGVDEGDKEAQIADKLSLMNHFYWVCYGQELSPLQGRVIRTALWEHYHGSKETLTVTDLINALDDMEAKSQGLGGWPEAIQAVISRLWPLTISTVGSTLNRRYSTLKTADLFEPRLTIIDLSLLPDDNSRNLLSQILLKQVYDETRRRAKPADGGILLVFLVDEAHHVCPNRRDYISIPERCAIELRKYGFCLVTCATRPTLVSPNIVANSNTLICHMLNNLDDVEAAAGFFMGGASVRDSLRRLAVGEAMIQINSPKPMNPVRCRVNAMRRGSAATDQTFELQERTK